MSLRILSRAAAIVVIAWLSAATIRADYGAAALANANYSKPLRWTFGGTLLLSQDFDKEGGLAGLSTVGNADVRAVVARTWDNPRGAFANSTYVGGEVGWGLLWRVSVGYAKRIAGPSTSDDHIITWGLGVDIPAWFRQRAASPSRRPAP